MNTPDTPMIYLIQLKDGNTRQLTTQQFRAVFSIPGKTHEARLEQLRYFYSDAVNWILVEKKD